MAFNPTEWNEEFTATINRPEDGDPSGAFDSTPNDVAQVVQGQVISKIRANGLDYELVDAQIRNFMGIEEDEESGVLSSSVMDAIDSELNNMGEDLHIAEEAINALETKINESISGAYVFRGTVDEQGIADELEDGALYTIGEIEGEGGVDGYIGFIPADEGAEAGVGGVFKLEPGTVVNVTSETVESGEEDKFGMNYAWTGSSWDALGAVFASAMAAGGTKTNLDNDCSLSELDEGLSSDVEYDNGGVNGLMTAEDKSDLTELKNAYNVTAEVTSETLIFTATNLISGDYATL